jgi:hypothetical protein
MLNDAALAFTPTSVLCVGHDPQFGTVSRISVRNGHSLAIDVTSQPQREPMSCAIPITIVK